ncbi:MAG: 50S ribosomal protein L32 [Lentisphaerae bacterium]|jgi:large subunit ribosomal protein L32|nr:50S ribosomal protein L32 [Lentisphaerota bacterium]
MAVPKRKTSRMQRRQRKAANRYEGVAATFCPSCKAPVMPHRVCTACGQYNGKQVISTEA